MSNKPTINEVDSTTIASAADVTTNTSNISTNTSNISTNTSNISTIDTRLTTLEGLVTGYLSVGSSTTLTSSSYGLLVDCTAALTITLPDATTVGSGWFVDVRRSAMGSSDYVTVERAGTDTISYGSDTTETSLILAGDGTDIKFISTGSSWVALGDLAVELNVYPGFPLTSGGQTITDNTSDEVVEFDTVNRDTHSGFNAVTYEYTIPISGRYYINANSVFQEGNSGNYQASLKVMVNNDPAITDNNAITDDAARTFLNQLSARGLWVFDKGDVIKVEAYIYNGGSADRVINNGDWSTVGANQAIWQMTRLGDRW